MTRTDTAAMHALTALAHRDPEPAEIMRERAADLPIRAFYVLAAAIGGGPLEADTAAILRGSRIAAHALRLYETATAARAALLAE